MSWESAYVTRCREDLALKIKSLGLTPLQEITLLRLVDKAITLAEDEGYRRGLADADEERN